MPILELVLQWSSFLSGPKTFLSHEEMLMFILGLWCQKQVQYTPRNMHTVFALLCLVVVIHWLIFPYPSGLLHWHCGNLTIAPVPAKQLWWIWINTSCEFIMNDCITTTKQSTTKPCAYFLGYTVSQACHSKLWGVITYPCLWYLLLASKSSYDISWLYRSINTWFTFSMFSTIVGNAFFAMIKSY